MAKAPKESAGNEASPPRKFNFKIVAIGVVALLLLGGGAALFFFKFAGHSGTKGPEKTEEKAKSAKKVTPTPEPAKKDGEEYSADELAGVVVVKPTVVNLADTDANRFIRIGVSLGASVKELTEKYEKDPLIQSQVQDAIISVLSSKTSQELLSPDGKKKLKKELRDRLNTKLEGSPIVTVFFTEFLVQL